ncbi:DUF2958 domain-containing protein [Variovorax sp. RB2P76]|uniref:DUF2958 domain-containing protein n=1 Tax=Variovorax sp. RB2P76 TaxID=3443736 RepID=UPI003F45D437
MAREDAACVALPLARGFGNLRAGCQGRSGDPNAGATWLLSELDAEGIAFRVRDLELGCPELGYVSLAELEGFQGRWSAADRA